jgi:hypothetical protein
MVEENVTFDQIKEHPLLWGDLFWKRPSGRVTCIGRAGELADLKLVEKTSGVGELSIQPIISDELVSEITNLLDELKNCNNERERASFRKDFSTIFYDVFVGDKQGSFLDWAVALYRSFYDVPEKISEVFISKNLVYTHRSFTVSSMATAMSFTMGYMNWEFLKGIYNSVLVIDYDLVKSGLNQFELNELDAVRLGSESPFEKAYMKKFVERDYKTVVAGLSAVTRDNPYFEQLNAFAHEIFTSGMGPFQAFDSEVSDLFKIVSLVERFIPYTPHRSSVGDATGTLLDFITKLEGHARIKRMIQIQSLGAA